MTFATSGNFNVEFMTEMRGTGLFYLVGYFLNRMTGDAFINSEGLLAVMTGTARLSFSHGVHAHTRVFSCFEKRVVACAAFTIFLQMNRMFKQHRPGFLYLVDYVLDLVAGCAFCQSKGAHAIVALAA